MWYDGTTPNFAPDKISCYLRDGVKEIIECLPAALSSNQTYAEVYHKVQYCYSVYYNLFRFYHFSFFVVSCGFLSF